MPPPSLARFKPGLTGNQIVCFLNSPKADPGGDGRAKGISQASCSGSKIVPFLTSGDKVSERVIKIIFKKVKLKWLVKHRKVKSDQFLKHCEASQNQLHSMLNTHSPSQPAPLDPPLPESGEIPIY